MGLFSNPTPKAKKPTAEEKTIADYNKEVNEFKQFILHETDSDVIILRRDFCDDELVFPPVSVITSGMVDNKNTFTAVSMIDAMKILIGFGYEMKFANVLPGKKEYIFIRKV